jgi:undecaprenyl-diphosphatase
MTRNDPTEPNGRLSAAILALVVIAALLAVVSYFFLDDRVVSWLVRDGVAWRRTAPVRAFALLGKSWLQIWLLLVCLCWPRKRARPVIAALCTIAVLALVVPTLKVAVHRTRPNATQATVVLEDPKDNQKTWYDKASFPSGDTSTACGIAAALGSFMGAPWIAALLAVGAGVGALRVVSLAHHPSDVLAGAAIGVLCAWWVARTVRVWPYPKRASLVVFRRLTMVGLVAIPLVILLSHNTQRSTLFVWAYALPIAVLYVLQKAVSRLRRPAERKAFRMWTDISPETE